jgi:shikimate dehydrogenase
MTGRADDVSPVQRYAVLGYPVRHSLSPPMQNAAFRAAGLNALYEAREVPLGRLDDALARFHEEGVVGLNLTLPLKERGWTLVSTRTPEAERARAVNTLRREAGGWAGHATDGLGFDAWVRELGLALAGAKVLLLGAGGAAASIAPVLLDQGPAALAIVSRTRERASVLADRLGREGKVPVIPGGLDGDPDEIERAGPFDLLVRALTVEDVGEREASLWRALEPRAPVLDLNYAERAACVRARCETEGRPFEDGLGLLLHQGALSFEFWIGRSAPIDAMREALQAAARPT